MIKLGKSICFVSLLISCSSTNNKYCKIKEELEFNRKSINEFSESDFNEYLWYDSVCNVSAGKVDETNDEDVPFIWKVIGEILKMMI